MTLLRTKWSAYIDRQHRNPSGFIGQMIAERMRRQHTPETDWSIDLLHLQPADRVLEVGFGAGRGLELTLAQVYQQCITGVDLSPTIIKAAARRYHNAIEQNQIILVRGNIANLPFGEQQFDKLLTIHTFYFWPDPYAVCTDLVRLLARGGRLVSTFATARRLPNGAWDFWDVHHLAEALVKEFDQHPNLAATLLYGPDSRDYNNIAIVIDKVY